MTGNFKANLPYNNFLLLIYGLIIKWPLFVNNTVPKISKDDTFLYKYLLTALLNINHQFHLFSAFVVFILLYFQAVFLNRLAINQKMFSKPNYLTGMTYLLFTSLFSSFYTFSALLICSTFIIAIFSMLSKLSNTQDAKKILFNMGLILGISSFIYYPMLLFASVIYLSFFTFRPFRLAEVVIMFLGVLTPFYFLYAYFFLQDYKFEGLFPRFLFYKPNLSLSKPELIALILLAIIFCIGVYFLQKNMTRLLVQSRKMWNVSFYFLMISLIVFFMTEHQYNIPANFLMIPFALISAATFTYIEKKLVVNILQWILVIIGFWVGYANI